MDLVDFAVGPIPGPLVLAGIAGLWMAALVWGAQELAAHWPGRGGTGNRMVRRLREHEIPSGSSEWMVTGVPRAAFGLGAEERAVPREAVGGGTASPSAK